VVRLTGLARECRCSVRHRWTRDIRWSGACPGRSRGENIDGQRSEQPRNPGGRARSGACSGDWPSSHATEPGQHPDLHLSGDGLVRRFLGRRCRTDSSPAVVPLGIRSGAIRHGCVSGERCARSQGRSRSRDQRLQLLDAAGSSKWGGAIALHGRLAYAEIARRGPRTTRGITVGDGINRLRHRYRGSLHGGRSGSLGFADSRLFASEVRGDATYELEFDIVHGRVIDISAGTRRTIETFGECA
jgi:hypothetical protein